MKNAPLLLCGISLLALSACSKSSSGAEAPAPEVAGTPGMPPRNPVENAVATRSPNATVALTATPAPSPTADAGAPTPAPTPEGTPRPVPTPSSLLEARYLTVCAAALKKDDVAARRGIPPAFSAEERAAFALYSSTGTSTCKDALAKLGNAAWLDLSRKRIVDTSFFPLLVSAKALLLQGNGIKETGSLAGLAKLESLSLSDNPLVSLKGLESLLWLKSLALSRTKLPENSLAPLAPLGALERLHMRGAALSEEDVRVIGGFSNLQELVLSDAKFSVPASIAQLKGLRSLRRLEAEGAGLKTLDFAARFSSMREIFVARNGITQLPERANWDRLETLVVADNPLEGANPFFENSKLTRLRTLVLEGTKIDSVAVVSKFSRLHYFNYERTPASPQACPLKLWDYCEH